MMVCWTEGSGRCNARLRDAPKLVHTVCQSGPGCWTDSENVKVNAEGLRTPKIHCDAATNLLGVFVRRQAVPMVYDTSKSAEGFGA